MASDPAAAVPALSVRWKLAEDWGRNAVIVVALASLAAAQWGRAIGQLPV
jgi:hypothetical protein